MLTDFHKFFTDGLGSKFTTNFVYVFHYAFSTLLHCLVKYECQKTSNNLKNILRLMINHKLV